MHTFVCIALMSCLNVILLFRCLVLLDRTPVCSEDQQHQRRILDHQRSSQEQYFQRSIIWLSKKQGKHNLLSAHIWFRSISLLYLHTVPMYFGLYIEVSYIFASPRYSQPLFLAAIVLKCVYRQSLISAMLSHLFVSLYSTRLVNRSCEWT